MNQLGIAKMRRLHWATLNHREIEILNLAADGLNSIETGERLFLTLQTVKFHRTNLYRKLNARGIAHAVAIGFRMGLIPMNKENTEAKKTALAKLNAAEDAAAEYARVLQNGGAIRGIEYRNFVSACDEFHVSLVKVFEE